MGLKGLGDFLKNFEGYKNSKSSEGHDSASNKRSLNAGEVFDFLALVRDWQIIVGEKLSKHTVPIKNSRQVLTILTDHPAYGQELSFLQTVLIKKIEDRFPALKGKIKRLLFQNDPTFLKTKFSLMTKANAQKDQANTNSAPKYHQHSPEFKAVKKMAEETFLHIDDEETRNALVSLFIQVKLEGV